MDRPILFSGPMVRALLGGLKTQTRRVLKPQPERPCSHVEPFRGEGGGWIAGNNTGHIFPCPYGQPGDRLWVRESVALDYFSATPWLEPHQRHGYRADWTHRAADSVPEPKWRPSIHMPRWASRLTLELTAVRVERLQDCSEEDAKAEGVNPEGPPGGLNVSDWRGHRFRYANLWDELNAKRGFGWATNPWVWVLTFKRAEAQEVAA